MSGVTGSSATRCHRGRPRLMSACMSSKHYGQQVSKVRTVSKGKANEGTQMRLQGNTGERMRGSALTVEAFHAICSCRSGRQVADAHDAEKACRDAWPSCAAINGGRTSCRSRLINTTAQSVSWQGCSAGRTGSLCPPVSHADL